MLRQQTRSRVANGLERAHLLAPAARVRESWLVLRACEGRVASAGELALPPAKLRLLVDGRSGEAGRFVAIGAQMFESIRGAVAASGTPVEQLGAVLDFGCGSGRVARHWAGVDGPELHGCDYNPELVKWCRGNLPFMNASRNSLVPPTPYAKESFDLVYALSVFSHLTEPLQRDWIAEMRRILRPGGLLVISVLGHQVQERLTAPERERFGRGELIVERPRLAGRNLCTAYHPRSYVEGTLLAGFGDVCLFDLGSPQLPVKQDAYLARR